MGDESRTRSVRAWSRDELILALRLYIECNGSDPGKTSARVRELSENIRALHDHKVVAPDFRNTNAVYMKLMNFRRFDPSFIESGRKGLTRGNKLEAEVWSDFSQDVEALSGVSASILNAARAGIRIGDDDEGAQSREGTILMKLHRYRERDSGLARRKKESALKATGRLRCEACGFDSAERYGERGLGVIDVHHKTPLHALAAGAVTKLADLALLCANCHRVIHARKRWISVEELAAQMARR